MVGYAQGDRVLPAGDLAWHLVAGGEHQGERPGPGGCGKAAGGFGHGCGPIRHIVCPREMDDERMVERALFEREHLGHRVGIARIGSEPVDGLGRHGDHAASAEDGDGLLKVGAQKVEGGGARAHHSANFNRGAAGRRLKPWRLAAWLRLLVPPQLIQQCRGIM